MGQKAFPLGNRASFGEGVRGGGGDKRCGAVFVALGGAYII